MTRRLAREEGLLVGGSCGMAVVGGAARSPSGSARTTWSSCCCRTAAAATSARSSTTSGWPTTASWRSDGTAGARSATCCGARRARCPRWCTCTRTRRSARPSRCCASTASRRCRSSSRGAGHPDVMAAEVVGSVVERELLDALFTQRASLGDPLEKHMSAPLPHVGSGEPVADLMAVLERRRRGGRAGRGQAERGGEPAGPAGVPGERGPVRAPRVR